MAAAAGINPKRGDTMTQSTVVFAKPKAAPGPAGLPVPPAFVTPLKYAGIGLASILFLFFMTRALRRREQEALPMPTWLTEIEGPRPLAELEQSTTVGPGAGRRRRAAPRPSPGARRSTTSCRSSLSASPSSCAPGSARIRNERGHARP